MSESAWACACRRAQSLFVEILIPDAHHHTAHVRTPPARRRSLRLRQPVQDSWDSHSRERDQCNNSDFQPPDLNVLAYTVPGERRASPERGADAPFLPMRAALAQGGPNISTPRRCWWADSPWRVQRLASSAQAQHV